MAFGQELKDFVSAMNTTSNMFDRSERTKAVRDGAKLKREAYEHAKNGTEEAVIARERAALRAAPRDLTLTPTATPAAPASAAPTSALPTVKPSPSTDVGFYAEGGPVEDYGEESANTYYTRENARARGAGQPAPNDFYGSAMSAVREGLSTLQEEYGLSPKQALPTGAPTAINPEGARNFMRATNAPDPALAAQARQAVNPNGDMDDAMESMTVLARAREHFLKNGDPDKARRVSASLLDYYRTVSQKMGAMAVVAGQRGDTPGMVRAAVKASNLLPDGTSMEASVTPDGNITYTQRNMQSGKVVAGGTATPQQLLARAMGFASGQGALTELQRAAGEGQAAGARGRARGGARRGRRGGSRGGARARVSDEQRAAYEQFLAGEGAPAGGSDTPGSSDEPNAGDDWTPDAPSDSPNAGDDWASDEPRAAAPQRRASPPEGAEPDEYSQAEATPPLRRALPAGGRTPDEYSQADAPPPPQRPNLDYANQMQDEFQRAVAARGFGDTGDAFGTGLQAAQRQGEVPDPRIGPAPRRGEDPPPPSPPDRREFEVQPPTLRPLPPIFDMAQLSPEQRSQWARMSGPQRNSIINTYKARRKAVDDENRAALTQYRAEVGAMRQAASAAGRTYQSEVGQHNRGVAQTNAQYRQQQADWLKYTAPESYSPDDRAKYAGEIDEALKKMDPVAHKKLSEEEGRMHQELGISLLSTNRLPVQSVARAVATLARVDERNPEATPFRVVRDPSYRERIGIVMPDNTKLVMTADGFDRLVALRSVARDQAYEAQRKAAAKRTRAGTAEQRQRDIRAYNVEQLKRGVEAQRARASKPVTGMPTPPTRIRAIPLQ